MSAPITDGWLCAPPAPSRPPAPLDDLLGKATHAQGSAR